MPKAKLKIDGVDQLAHLRKQIHEHESTIRKLRTELGSQREFAQACCAATAAMPPLAPFRYQTKSTGSVVVAVIKLSDWHIGELIKAVETEGLNAYSFAIANARLNSILQSFLGWIEVQRSAYRIDQCVILGEGDWVSGDIHPELLATNEFPLPEQSARAGELLAHAIRVIASHFKEVEAVLVGADNHGRLTRRPQAKQKSSNNMSLVVHSIARAATRPCANLQIIEAKGAKYLHKINGWKFLIEHGDAVRGWAGLPFYGFNRTIGREAIRRMNTDLGFDYWSIGHFHVPTMLEMRTLVNGSLSGTSEFDHICGRHARPAQVAFLVHQKHGIFNWVPFHG